jgi:hypothetical protein
MIAVAAAPTWIKRMLLATGSSARFSGALASLWSGTRAQPHRDVDRLHRLTHRPTTSSFADGFSTSSGDGIVLVIITTLLPEPFALYLPAHFAGYPLHESQVALPEPGICFVTDAAQRAV